MSYKHFKLHMRCLFIKHLYHVISLDYFRQVLFSALTPMMSYLLHYGAERVSGANLSIFDAVIELARISMHNNPSTSLDEIKRGGQEWETEGGGSTHVWAGVTS